MTFALVVLLMGQTFNEDVMLEINLYRFTLGLPICREEPKLSRAAGLHIEWKAYALKRRLEAPDHVTNTAWLKEAHPELDWAALDATFPEGPPEWIGAFDLGRLCGYNGGFVGDVGAYVRRKATAGEIVDGWIYSPGHNFFLTWPDFHAMGVAKGSLGQGQTGVFVFFGGE